MCRTLSRAVPDYLVEFNLKVRWSADRVYYVFLKNTKKIVLFLFLAFIYLREVSANGNKSGMGSKNNV